jgi:AcrR family transcriptional regulator
MSASPGAASRRSAYHHGDLYRSLLKAAGELMDEQQSWDFSLREVARRAGVSHNAPYNHFADKRELLAALAAEGFAELTARTAEAAASAAAPDAALLAIGVAYVRFGLTNPVRYRLMFGPGFSSFGADLPENVGCEAMGSKAVLREAVRVAAEAGLLTVTASDEAALEIVVLGAWSLVHGFTMLWLDGMTRPIGNRVAPDVAAEAVLRSQLGGILRDRAVGRKKQDRLFLKKAAKKALATGLGLSG